MLQKLRVQVHSGTYVLLKHFQYSHQFAYFYNLTTKLILVGRWQEVARLNRGKSTLLVPKTGTEQLLTIYLFLTRVLPPN